MCKASHEPGGPKRCSGDTRRRAAAAQEQVGHLEHRDRVIGEQLDAARTYGSEGAFRVALNTRIRQIAKETGLAHLEVGRRFALQQFVSRLFDRDPEPWLVTGGTALQYRSNEARPTRDLDLAVHGVSESLTARLTEAVARRPGEHGSFEIALAASDPGSFVGKITYLLGGTRFATAKLDIATHRTFPFAPDLLCPAPVVAIDDIWPMPAVRSYATASHLADKVAAMYELHGPDGVTPSSRSHDLADIVILSRCAAVDAEELHQAVRGEEQRRGITIPLPFVLPDSQWRASYRARSGVSSRLPGELRDADAALAEAQRFVGAVLDGRVRRGRWSPARREWMPDSA